MVNLFFMIFLHIVDDFFLQAPTLGKLKQKQFWEENAPDKKYKYDYLMALFMHCFSWAFMIMIPSIIANCFVWWLLPINLVIHFVVDHLKANLGKLNLIADQSIHLIQIIITWIICFII